MISIVLADLKQDRREDRCESLKSTIRIHTAHHADRDHLNYQSAKGCEELYELLEAMTLHDSHNTLVFCFVDPVNEDTQDRSPNSPIVKLGEYLGEVKKLVSFYPEVTFRFIDGNVKDGSGEQKAASDDPKSVMESCTAVFIAESGAPSVVATFLEGARDLFDPYGLRLILRAMGWRVGAVELNDLLKETRKRQYAYIFEDEPEYRDLLCYCAFRIGRYKVRRIERVPDGSNDPKMNGLSGLLEDYRKDEERSGVFVHQWNKLSWTGAQDCTQYKPLYDLKIERMVVTAAGKDSLRTVRPREWPKTNNEWPKTNNQWTAWTEGRKGKEEEKDGIPILRGLEKPIGWIHDLQREGLFPAWSGEDQIDWTFLDKVMEQARWGILTEGQEKDKKTLDADQSSERAKLMAKHSAQDKTQEAIKRLEKENAELEESLQNKREEKDKVWALKRKTLEKALGNEDQHAAMQEPRKMAQRLLGRAQDALKADEALLACVLSLEAIRWLRGYSSTLLSDALQCLYEAETELELQFGSSGSSSRIDAPRMRQKELEALLKRLNNKRSMPERQAPEVKERIWAALRRRYNEAGAFEPADEALQFIHDAHKDRSRLTLEWSLLQVWESVKLWAWNSLYVWVSLRLWNSVQSFWKFLKSHMPRTWIGWVGLIVLGFIGVILAALASAAPLVRFAGDGDLLVPLPNWWVTLLHWSGALPPWTPQAVPDLVLVGLALIWIRAWPKAALRPSAWARTVLWSILFLSAGNLALLSDPSPIESITAHRVKAYAESVAWTSGSALAQSLTDKFINGVKKQPDNKDKKITVTIAETLSFGWRGRTREDDPSDPDFGETQETQFPRTMLWLENVVAGWLSFATGLSTIYRKAARG